MYTRPLFRRQEPISCESFCKSYHVSIRAFDDSSPSSAIARAGMAATAGASAQKASLVFYTVAVYVSLLLLRLFFIIFVSFGEFSFH